MGGAAPRVKRVGMCLRKVGGTYGRACYLIDASAERRKDTPSRRRRVVRGVRIPIIVASLLRPYVLYQVNVRSITSQAIVVAFESVATINETSVKRRSIQGQDLSYN